MIDSVLDRRSDEPVLCSAVDWTGRHWLIIEAERGEQVHSWVCAPASSRVVELVKAGRATAADALLHSETGWVEMVRVIDGHSVPDRRITCADLATRGMPAALAGV